MISNFAKSYDFKEFKLQKRIKFFNDSVLEFIFLDLKV